MIYKILGFKNKEIYFSREYVKPNFSMDEYLLNMEYSEIMECDSKYYNKQTSIVFVSFDIQIIAITDDNEFYILEVLNYLNSIFSFFFEENKFMHNFFETHILLDNFILNGKLVETKFEKIIQF